MRYRFSAALASVVLGAATAVFGGVVAPPIASADASVELPIGKAFFAPQDSDYEGAGYTFTSASARPDVDGLTFVELDFDTVGGKNGLATYGDYFRLEAGGEKAAPTALDAPDVDSDATGHGTVAFLIPSAASAGTLSLTFPGTPATDIPITRITPTPAGTGAPGGSGVSMTLNAPLTSRFDTFKITSAAAKPEEGQTRLDLGFHIAAGPDGVSINNDRFRIQANGETIPSDECDCKTIASDSTGSGTVSFLVPSSLTKATLAIKFEEGDITVPMTFDEAKAAPKPKHS